MPRARKQICQKIPTLIQRAPAVPEPAEALVKSVDRLPNGSIAPANLDQPRSERRPVSLIGAALDLLQSLDNGGAGES